MNILFLSFSDIFNTTGSVTRILTEIELLRNQNINTGYLLFLPLKQFLKASAKNVLRNNFKRKKISLFIFPLITGNWINNLLFHFIDIYTTSVIAIVSMKLKPDIIHAHTTRSSYMAFLSKRFFKIKYVFDMHGAAVEELEERKYSGKIKKRLMTRTTRHEKLAAENSDLLICVSKRMEEILLLKYPGLKSRIIIIPCLADITRFYYSKAERTRMRKKLGISEKIVFVYSGSLTGYQSIDEMCSLFSFIRERIKNAIFLVLTKDNTEEIIGKMRKYGISPNEYIIKSAKHQDIPGYLCASDIGLLIRKNMSLNNVASPTKLGEYLACGVPVLSTPYAGDNELLFNNNEIGYLIDLRKKWPGGIINFIESVINEREYWSKKCSDYVINNYSWQGNIYQLLDAYFNISCKQRKTEDKVDAALQLDHYKSEHKY